MPKDYLADYSADAGSNTDIGGVNIDEGCAPSTLNDAIREIMSHLSGYKTQSEQGAAVASATALPVNVAGAAHSVTGTTTVTSLADPTNDTSNVKILTFAAALTLTNSANLILPGGANITTAAGDSGIFVYEGSSVWRCVSYVVAALKTGLLDEDDLVSDSDVQGATQQSIKAYVDSRSATLATPQASTSGTSIDFTSIPSGTKKISVMFKGVSTNGTSPICIQIGDSGGIETSSYTGTGSGIATSGSHTNHTAGFQISDSAGNQAAASVWNGVITLTLENSSSFTWAAFGLMSKSDSALHGLCSGVKSLSAELTQVRITTIGGANTFDAGEINVQYE